MKRAYWQLPFLIFLIAATVVIVRGHRQRPYRTLNGMVFGTTYTVTYQADSDMTYTIHRALDEIDMSLSAFNEKSTIAAVNRGENPDVDPLFRHVFTLAQTVSKETNGAFDITVAPLVNLWGFGWKQGQQPTDKAVDSLRALVGWNRVAIKGDKIVKDDPRITLDCAAIAKGYASDHVAAALANNGADNLMVEIGGEIVAKGKNSKQQPWRIGVTKPSDNALPTGNEELDTIVNVTNKAMATSGNYRNFYYKGGRKVAHTIDPATGRPVQHSLLSATVFAKDCATADAYATAFMVMGQEKAIEVLKKHNELKAILITANNDSTLRTWTNL